MKNLMDKRLTFKKEGATHSDALDTLKNKNVELIEEVLDHIEYNFKLYNKKNSLIENKNKIKKNIKKLKGGKGLLKTIKLLENIRIESPLINISKDDALDTLKNKNVELIEEALDHIENEFKPYNKKNSLIENKNKIKKNIKKLKGGKGLLKTLRLIKKFRTGNLLFDIGKEVLDEVVLEGIMKAIEFRLEFSEIQDLNKDKSQIELEDYRNTIKSTAWNLGTDIIETTQAFHNLQSITGFFGEEAKKVVEEVEKFSIVMNKDLNRSVNTTAESLRTFGLSARDTKMLLESNIKTVQVSKTTFEELAQAQLEYASAAIDAGQNVDIANKIFSGFISIAKDSEEAAIMTKIALQGLTQKSVIESLKKIGVNVYANGNIRDLAKVLQEASVKFKDMSPKQMNKLLNNTKDVEDIEFLFEKLKKGSDLFSNATNAFDKNKFEIDLALKNAEGFFSTLRKLVNKIDILRFLIGDAIVEAMDQTWEFILEENLKKIPIFIGEIPYGALSWYDSEILNKKPKNPEIMRKGDDQKNEIYSSTHDNLYPVDNSFNKSFANDIYILGEYEQNSIKLRIKKTVESTSEYTLKSELFPNMHGDLYPIDNSFNKFLITNDILEYVKQIYGESEMEIKTVKEDISKNVLIEDTKIGDSIRRKIKEIIQRDMYIELKMKKNEEEQEYDSLPKNPDTGYQFFSEDIDTGNQVTSVVGAGGQVRNVTVNIDAFNKGGINTIYRGEFNDKTPEDIEEWMINTAMRAMRMIEMGLS